jgi:integrase
MLRFLAETGLRIGEVIALHWQDVDLVKQQVRVEARIYRGRRDAPKSAYGRREVDIAPGLAAELRRWRMASPPSPEEDLVFPTSRGTAQDPDYLRRVVMRPAAKAADLVDKEGKPWCRFHTLRHTAVSRWLAGGLSIKEAQVMAGHHSPAFTQDVYGHLIPGRPRRDLSFLDAEGQEL